MAETIPGDRVAALLPHGHPFLFVEHAVVDGVSITGQYTISGEEDFLRGHFKDNPVFPASIMLEALGQLAVLYLLTADHPDLTGAVDPAKILFTAADGVRCTRVCRPGDTLALSAQARRLRHPGALFSGRVLVDGQKAAIAEEISLKFDYRA